MSPTASTSSKAPASSRLASIDVAEFFLGGVAACSACLFSNPLEVVKTRMQLQGELRARGTYRRHYRNVFHAFATIGRVDGPLALQKGLVPALWYQLVMNGFRLGTYQCLQDLGMTRNARGEVSVVRSVAAGAVAGCTGAFFASPLYMVKTHLQATSHDVIAVGYQHKHVSFTAALRRIYGQGGFTGLWRGVSAAVVRVSVGSAAQLSTFSTAKEMVLKTNFFHPHSVAVPFCASMFSGVAVVLVMTPFDVISTRLYNQGLDPRGKGIYYSGFCDCLVKIFRKEGFFGFYKGWSASWFRTAPHTVLSLLFWDETRKLYKRFRGTL